MVEEPIVTTVPAKTKVVVLGGGPAAVAAAFWLSSSPELQSRYDVTLYTRGWRLGGKCASGRNASSGQRIEEHGLHFLMGFYQNAFRTLRACYDAWRPPTGLFREWTEAFTAQRRITLEDQDAAGWLHDWAPWTFDFPQLPGEPGDVSAAALAPASTQVRAHGDCDNAGITTQELVVRLADRLENWLPKHLPADVLGNYRLACEALRQAALNPTQPFLRTATGGIKPHNELQALADRIRSRMTQPAYAAPPPTPLAKGLASGVARKLVGPLLGPRLMASLLCLLGRLRPRTIDRSFILADLALSIAFGLARDILPSNPGFAQLNKWDFREWLRSCGAQNATLSSAPIRALYDLTFAYRGGDASSLANGSIAAGCTLRFVLEATLGYRDAPLWRMSSGMGDTVFTPFYDVLRADGVTIKLFHRLTGIVPAPGNNAVATITLDKQADFNGSDYDPIVVVNGRRCWPNQPLWGQLRNGAALAASGVNFESSWDSTFTQNIALQVGTDFDVVVLAVPPESIKLAAPLLRQDPGWQNMLANSVSVATQSFQFWLYPTLDELGWPLRSTVLSAYAEPFDSWADMSHLLPSEAWTGLNPPHAIAYFCGCLAVPVVVPPAPDPIPSMTAVVRSNAQQWLISSIATLWPLLPAGGVLDPSVLAADFYRANVDLSELYVQTPANSVQYRLSSSASSFGNLYVAGDWTLTRFSGGCLESAFESGMLAAAAICGQPTGIVTGSG